MHAREHNRRLLCNILDTIGDTVICIQFPRVSAQKTVTRTCEVQSHAKLSHVHVQYWKITGTSGRL